MRFSVTTLLVAVAVIGFACAALIYATELWAAAAFTMTLGILLFSLVATKLRTGRTRNFWAGFAFFGWAYALLAFGPWCEAHVAPHLLTTHALKPMHIRFEPSRVQRQARPGFTVQWHDESNIRTGPYQIWNIWGSSWQCTQRIGHATFAVVAGLVGGTVAACMAQRAVRPESH